MPIFGGPGFYGFLSGAAQQLAKSQDPEYQARRYMAARTPYLEALKEQRNDEDYNRAVAMNKLQQKLQNQNIAASEFNLEQAKKLSERQAAEANRKKNYADLVAMGVDPIEAMKNTLPEEYAKYKIGLDAETRKETAQEKRQNAANALILNRMKVNQDYAKELIELRQKDNVSVKPGAAPTARPLSAGDFGKLQDRITESGFVIRAYDSTIGSISDGMKQTDKPGFFGGLFGQKEEPSEYVTYTDYTGEKPFVTTVARSEAKRLLNDFRIAAELEEKTQREYENFLNERTSQQSGGFGAPSTLPGLPAQPPDKPFSTRPPTGNTKAAAPQKKPEDYTTQELLQWVVKNSPNKNSDFFKLSGQDQLKAVEATRQNIIQQIRGGKPKPQTKKAKAVQRRGGK